MILAIIELEEDSVTKFHQRITLLYNTNRLMSGQGSHINDPAIVFEQQQNLGQRYGRLNIFKYPPPVAAVAICSKAVFLLLLLSMLLLQLCAGVLLLL